MTKTWVEDGFLGGTVRLQICGRKWVRRYEITWSLWATKYLVPQPGTLSMLSNVLYSVSVECI